MNEQWKKLQYWRKFELRVRYQQGNMEDFERQMIEIVRDEAILQKMNLMLILYDMNLRIESVLISNYRNGLLFGKKFLMYCLFETQLIQF